MIRFALTCRAGHQFEAWFSSGDSFGEQTEAQAILCPDCGTSDVHKAPMAPAVLRGRGKPSGPKTNVAAAPEDQQPEGAGRVYAFTKGLRERLEATADDVGKDFAEEARKMHYGETDARDIYGEATTDEAKSLLEEGIPALPLPKLPDDHN